MLSRNCFNFVLLIVLSMSLNACANFPRKTNQPAICKEIKHRQMFGDKGISPANVWKNRAEQVRLDRDYRTEGCG